MHVLSLFWVHILYSQLWVLLLTYTTAITTVDQFCTLPDNANPSVAQFCPGQRTWHMFSVTWIILLLFPMKQLWLQDIEGHDINHIQKSILTIFICGVGDGFTIGSKPCLSAGSDLQCIRCVWNQIRESLCPWWTDEFCPDILIRLGTISEHIIISSYLTIAGATGRSLPAKFQHGWIFLS